MDIISEQDRQVIGIVFDRLAHLLTCNTLPTPLGRKHRGASLYFLPIENPP